MLLSVLIPNYNHGKFLPQLLKEVFNQSLKPDEVLIIDDASTDNSVAIIQELQEKYPEIKLIQNRTNQGVEKNVNKGTKRAQGKYLIYLAADDWIFPNFYEESVKSLETFSDAGLCTGKMAFFYDEKPPYLFQYSEVKKVREGYYSPEDVFHLFRKTSFFIYTTPTCYRREVITKQEKKYGYTADCEMNLTMALERGIVYLPQLFGACRVDTNSYAANSRKSIKDREAIFKALLEDFEKRGKLWKNAMLRGGVLSHFGINMVQYLAKSPCYWKYLPFTFLKKCQFYLNNKKIKFL